MPLRNIPTGTTVHNIELRPGAGYCVPADDRDLFLLDELAGGELLLAAALGGAPLAVNGRKVDVVVAGNDRDLDRAGNAVELADKKRLEDVWYLLFEGHLPSRAERDAFRERNAWALDWEWFAGDDALDDRMHARQVDAADARDATKEHDRCGSHLMAPLLAANLAGTALLHSAIVTEKRGAFKSWTVAPEIPGSPASCTPSSS